LGETLHARRRHVAGNLDLDSARLLYAARLLCAEAARQRADLGEVEETSLTCLPCIAAMCSVAFPPLWPKADAKPTSRSVTATVARTLRFAMLLLVVVVEVVVADVLGKRELRRLLRRRRYSTTKREKTGYGHVL
jgi:hypothetical protein